MPEAEPSSLYRPRTARQDQWFLQLERACAADQWVSCSLFAEHAPTLPVVISTPEGDRHILELTPRFLLGIRRIIFSRLIDLTHEGHGHEALERVAGWRAAPPDSSRAPSD
jgi:hypothetical protein